MSKKHAKHLTTKEIHQRATGFARSAMMHNYNRLVLDPRMQHAIMAVQTELAKQLDALPDEYQTVECGIVLVSQVMCVVASVTVGSIVDTSDEAVCTEEECLQMHRATIGLGLGYLASTALMGEKVDPDNMEMQ